MNRICAPALAAVLVLLASCATAPGPAHGTGPAPAEVPSTANASESTLARMEEFLSGGRARINEGSVMEGARQLVAVLAEGRTLEEASTEKRELEGQARAELTRLAAALVLDSGVEWLDENKNQRSGSPLDVGSPGAIQPSVVLSYTMGKGRTLVAGAPVVFEFVKGSGTLTGSVTTNEYGQATCSLARLDLQTQESVIRAGVVISAGGLGFRLQGVERDFVYVPPSRRATILALERSPKGASQPPLILDHVYNALKGVAFDFSNYDGVLAGEAFARVFAGDPKAIQALGVQKDVSYLVVVLNDCTEVKQVVLDGKTYNIFKSQATATTRIVRVADGKILYSGAVQGVAGQGGDAGKAAAEGLRKAAAEMGSKLAADLPQISAALVQKGK